MKLAETELGRVVVAWLRAEGWTVYQEVPAGDSAADIVAVVGSIVWVIECKTSLSIDVIEQARAWRRHAHIVSVAVPHARTRREFAREVLRWQGLGLLVVEIPQFGDAACRETERPALARRISTRITGALRPEHLTHAEAGDPYARRFTRFVETCRDLRREVDTEPGVLLRDVIGRIAHHYRHAASARSVLLRRIEDNTIAGLRVERSADGPRLYVTAVVDGPPQPQQAIAARAGDVTT